MHTQEGRAPSRLWARTSLASGCITEYSLPTFEKESDPVQGLGRDWCGSAAIFRGYHAKK